MKKSDKIKEEIKIYEPYALAHKIYFDKLGRLKESQYKRILKHLAITKLESDTYFEEYYTNFFCFDTTTEEVSTLAIAFQDVISYRIAHSHFKKSPKNQPLNFKKI